MDMTRTFALAVLCTSLLAACGDKSAPKPAAKPAPDPLAVSAGPDLRARITLGAPASAEVRETLRVPGRIEVDETRLARVGSPVTGRISDLAATVGQPVRRGQVLATLNSTELSSAQLSFLKAQSEHQLAARGVARAQQLLDADVIGNAELQRRQGELTQASAELNASRDQLKVLGMSEPAIQKLSQSGTITSLTQVVSSIGGTVIERKVTEGQVVQPADSVFLVADLSTVWVVADIPEQSSGMVRVGESVAVEVGALPNQILSGRLSFVSPTLNPETRTVRARMDLPNAQGLFKPAMLATVQIKGVAQTRLVVPAAAVVREDNRDYVFVQTGADSFRLQAVSLGAEYEGRRVVSGGLDENARIVVDGAFHLNNERKRRALDGSTGGG